MTYRATAVLAAAACLGLALGCGDDDGGGMAKASCDRQCEAQDAVDGCEPFVDLSTCKLLCASLVREVDKDCTDEFVAYYDCSANQGFECGGFGVTQEIEPCKSAQDELDACQGTPMCVGADDGGFCPSVSCPCPEGAIDVSGYSNESGECRCHDEETCIDFYCD